jgi:hypothetical protein
VRLDWSIRVLVPFALRVPQGIKERKSLFDLSLLNYLQSCLLTNITQSLSFGSPVSSVLFVVLPSPVRHSTATCVFPLLMLTCILHRVAVSLVRHSVTMPRSVWCVVTVSDLSACSCLTLEVSLLFYSILLITD